MPSSFFALFDDIASLLDDVATMTKRATAKTAGVLGDDLALNAQQVSGVSANRELPVVWAVAKGSLVNKAILVPAALAISAFLPWLVTPLLMVGGAYLCFEGVEKVLHTLLHRKHHDSAEAFDHGVEAAADADILTLEREKVKGAIRTDFILSAEIIVIALGTVADAPFLQRLTVLVAIALLMTVGVYGLVAAIVKLDDAGLALARRPGTAPLGRGLLWLAPKLMRGLTVIGTIAMFMVGGSIITHGIPALHPLIGQYSSAIAGWLAQQAFNIVVGALVGLLGVALVKLVQALRGGGPAQA